MFLDFYGLTEQPFGVTPDPRFFFKTGSHCEALATLMCGIEEYVGFAALFSEPGLGKTTLLYQILARYSESAHTAFIYNTKCNGAELLRQIAEELRLESTENPIRIHSALKDLVAADAHGLPVLIIVDEGQNLDDGALETLRLLSDFETPTRKLIHFILSGQPNFADRLARPAVSQLLDRIVTLSQLAPLAASEVGNYIAYRLSVAGYAGRPIFTTNAVADIAATSRGVPRQINRLCFNSLLLGFALRRQSIDRDILAEVIEDLDIGRCSPMLRQPLSSSLRPADSEEDSKSLRHPWRDADFGRREPKFAQARPSSVQDIARAQQQPALAHGRSVSRGSGTPPRRRPRGRRREFVYFAPLLLTACLFLASRYYKSLVDNVSYSSVEMPGGVQPAGHISGKENPAQSNSARGAGTQQVGLEARTERRKLRPIVSTKTSPGVIKTVTAGDAGAEQGSPIASKNNASLEDGVELLFPGPSSPRPIAPNQIHEGRLIRSVRPVYPAPALRSHMQGDVVLALDVSDKGVVEHVQVVSGNDLLAQAAVDAVRQWQYEPYTVDGKPSNVSLYMTVRFRLSPSS